jgi:hypothetical protein
MKSNDSKGKDEQREPFNFLLFSGEERQAEEQLCLQGFSHSVEATLFSVHQRER